MYQLIQQQHDLEKVLSQMTDNSIYGLDTEFIKVDTLWPKLGLFQINIDGQVYLLDGTTLDLSQFWFNIFKAKQNIFHACSEDIDLIYHYSKNKKLDNVFDTQVAMSFLGHGLQISYQNALKTLLSIEIEKDQTRSDWLARPLSEKQLSYAANDVLYLVELSNQLKQQLNAKNILSFVEEDCVHLTQEIATETPLELLYQDVGNYRHNRRQLMQLQQLAVWREQMAKALNQPRSFLLKNATMIDLAEKNPKNLFQLSNIKDIRANVVREYGKTILDLLKFLPEVDAWPARIARPIRHSSNTFSQKIDAILQNVTDDTGIPKEVLLRKKWLNALFQHTLNHGHEKNLPAYLLGWRYENLTLPILKMMKEDEMLLSMQG